MENTEIPGSRNKHRLSSIYYLKEVRTMKKAEITRLFPAHIRNALEAAQFPMEQVYEIRLRVNAPLIVISQGKDYFLSE